jgi:hypothetical protein
MRYFLSDGSTFPRLPKDSLRLAGQTQAHVPPLIEGECGETGEHGVNGRAASVHVWPERGSQ